MPGTQLIDKQRWRPDIHLLDGLLVAAVALDADGRVVYLNPAAVARFGWDPAQRVGQDGLSLLFPPASVGSATEVLGRVLSGTGWAGELPVLAADGLTHPTGTCWSPTHHDGVPSGALVLVEEPTDGQSHPRRLASRLQRLAAVTTELLAATDVATVTDIVIHHMADAAGATVSSLSLLADPDTLALVGIRGGRDGVASRWATYPLAAATPAGDAVRAGRTLVIAGGDEFRRRYPDIELTTDGERSMVCLPLRVARRCLGVVTLSFPSERPFETAELDFLGVLADTCGQALDRIQALADVADREAKLRFLADASAQLASSLDYAATLKAVATLAVPQFADWCVIQLLQDGVLRPLATAHPDAQLESRVLELQERYPSDPHAPRGAYQVVRTGVSELLPDITDDMLAASARDETHLQVLRDLHFRSALSVPLKVRDTVLGVITWVAGDEGRRFGRDDLAFGEDLARRAAVAIDNAHLHSQVRDVAIKLQRAVLPDQPPDLPGWDVAVRYLPAGRTEVGGDFYDVLSLPDGRVVALVGDVMGRGVAAAASMAQMRSALRTLVAVDPDPAFVMSGLDALFEQFDLNRLVTVAYAVADPGLDLLHVVNAGHPCPIILYADGRAVDLAADDVLVLGAGGGTRKVVTYPFGEDDTLLMFTDGLVERREESLDHGQRRIHDCASLLRSADLDAGLRNLVDTVRDETRDDDVAAVALRRRADAVRP